MAKIIMGYWDCPSCSATVKGTLRSCPSCNTARGEGVTFYTKDVEYLSEEEAAKIGQQPDWLCEFCGTYNNAQTANCKGCGAVRGNDNKDYFEVNQGKSRAHEKDESKWECAYCGAQNPDSEDHCLTCKAARSEKKKEVKAPEPKRKLPSWLPIAIILGIIAFVTLIAILGRPKKEELTVKEVGWETVVSVKDYLLQSEKKTTNRSDIPEDAVITDTKTETYKEREIVGKEEYTVQVDLGNGTFEERIEYKDVYGDVEKTRTVYYYRPYAWETIKTLYKTGTDKKAVYEEYTDLSGVQKLETEVKYYLIDSAGNRYTITKEEIFLKVEAGKSYTFKVKNDVISGLVE